MFEETKPWPDPVGICRNLIFQSFSNSILDPCSINGWSTTQQVHWVWSATPQAVSLVCWMRSRSWLFGSIGMMFFFTLFSYVEMAHQYGPFSSMIYLYYSVLSILLGWFSIGFNYPKVKRNSEGIWKAWFYCRASLTGDAFPSLCTCLATPPAPAEQHAKRLPPVYFPGRSPLQRARYRYFVFRFLQFPSEWNTMEDGISHRNGMTPLEFSRIHRRKKIHLNHFGMLCFIQGHDVS